MPAIDTDQTGGGIDFSPSDTLIRFRATYTNETDPDNDIYVFHINGGTGSKLVFQDSGSLYSFGAGSALWLQTNIDVTVNAGSTISSERFAVQLDGTGVSLSLTNFGKIHGDDTAIYVAASSASHHLINYGEISGTAYSYYDGNTATVSTIDNWGTMVGAIALSGGTGEAVNNYGTIVGQLDLYTGADTVFNSGTMRGSIAITSSFTTGSGDKTITNTGVIESTDITGANTAIKLFDGEDSLTNSGVIHGKIDFGSGMDTIFNAGTIAGDVYMGDGADNIYAYPNGYFQGIVHLDAGEDYFEGSDFLDRVQGGAGSDYIYTAAGDDLLIGNDDSSSDTLAGGTGSDTYHVGAGDIISEKTGEGHDSVVAHSSYTLAAGVEAEEFSAAASNLTLTGNEFVQTITGAGGNETLSGGGNGDTLIGQTGNDTYVLGANTATIIEQIGEGTADLVTSTISRSLAPFANVERLTLLNVATAISATGNALANIITGNSFNNVLDGGTDSAIDTLQGGLGNDTYVLGASTNDVVVETTAGNAGGIDTATSLISRSLAVGGLVNVENLTLLNVSTAITATGNNLNNTLTGNSFANTLSGGIGTDTLVGGLGNDTLNGGVGNDIFVFNTAPNSVSNRDTIDFRNVAGDNDSFQLDNAVFTKLGANGALNAAFFKVVGSGPLDANDYIQYSQATGQLIYDTNGSGAGGGIVFATLINKPVLTAADFVVI